MAEICDFCNGSGMVWCDWIGVDGNAGYVTCPECGPLQVRPVED